MILIGLLFLGFTGFGPLRYYLAPFMAVGYWFLTILH
jgi:hypothetical protein